MALMLPGPDGKGGFRCVGKNRPNGTWLAEKPAELTEK